MLVRSGVEEAGPKVGGGVGCDVQGSSVLKWAACFSFPAEMGEVAGGDV